MTLDIGTLVGYVDLDTKGVDRGARAATAGLKQVEQRFGSTGSIASRASGAIKLALGGLGIAKVAKDSVNLEADFSKSMAQIAVATGTPKSGIATLSALAMKMGKDTSFSASDAADAMLELAKAGVTTKDIMGGGLAGTLTLAAAGGTDLATASTIASNAMNSFGLSGKNMNKIAAALAGGANASSASVESLGQALGQVGPGAVNAGLSLNETVAALAAFDNAGIKGSDAGTSLKTMLANLVPQTDSASAALMSVGLWSEKTGSKFINANGSFKSLAQISGLLQAKLGKLSAAQRTQALNSIFGSDASRAALVLMKQGSGGIKKLIKATNDQSAAQKMANANMSGTAGALERMHGAIETAELAIGKAMAPAVQFLAAEVGELAGKVANATDWMTKHKHVVIAVAAALAPLIALTAAHAAVLAVSAAGGMSAWLKGTRLISSATKVWAAVQWAMNAAMAANPIVLVVAAIVALVAAVVIAYKKSETFRAIVTNAFNAVWHAAQAAFGWVKKNWPLLLAIITGPIGLATLAVVRNWDKIKAGATSVRNWVVRKFADITGWIASIPGKIAGLGTQFGKAGRDLLQSFIDGMKNAAGIIGGIAGNIWKAVKGLLNGAIDKINRALEFKISLPLGKSVGVNPPDIPHLATGGRIDTERGIVARIGEREPETVFRDRDILKLLTKAHDAGASKAMAAQGLQGPLIGQVVQQPGESADQLAERLWFKTRTR